MGMSVGFILDKEEVKQIFCWITPVFPSFFSVLLIHSHLLSLSLSLLIQTVGLNSHKDKRRSVLSDRLTRHVIEIKQARKLVRGLMSLARALSLISRFVISLHIVNIHFDYLGSPENCRIDVISKYLFFTFSF